MQIHLLGTAAGGGVPQWNCNCAVCREARAETGRVQPRTQSSVAVSADGGSWFLLNASPDIRAQIESFGPLQPPAGKSRNSPIEGVLLTNADLDHTLGLMLLREGEQLHVHATSNVRRALTEGISFQPALESFCGTQWMEPSSVPQPLLCRDDFPSGLTCQAIALLGKAPRFMKTKTMEGNVVGYHLTDTKTGGRLLFLPDVAELNDTVLQWLPQCDALLFDGTFWSQTEMRDQGLGNLTAADMGHAPVSGVTGSLKVLAELQVQHKIYTHINNTNPMLIQDSPEAAAVRAAGCVVGCDGMEFKI
jgi:pyrroloquinoline quinone biosynthesis protein B